METDNYRNALLWHDYFLLLLFTGMRKMEAASLRWEDIDLKSKTITLQDTKNHEVHTLPMSDFVFELMDRRSRNKTSDFVFPAESKTGYIYEPKKAVNKLIDKVRLKDNISETFSKSGNSIFSSSAISIR